MKVSFHDNKGLQQFCNNYYSLVVILTQIMAGRRHLLSSQNADRWQHSTLPLITDQFPANWEEPYDTTRNVKLDENSLEFATVLENLRKSTRYQAWFDIKEVRVTKECTRHADQAVFCASHASVAYRKQLPPR